MRLSKSEKGLRSTTAHCMRPRGGLESGEAVLARTEVR